MRRGLICLLATLLGGCAATDQEVGTVVGSSLAGAAIGALGGAALNPWDRNAGATSGALAGAAVGGAIGYANVAQERQNQYQYRYYPNQPMPRPYAATRCTTYESVDAFGRVTTTERCVNLPATSPARVGIYGSY